MRTMKFVFRACAAAIVAATGKALVVFVCKRGAYGLHDGETHEVLGRDELDGIALARELVRDGRRKLGIGKELEIHFLPFCLNMTSLLIT